MKRVRNIALFFVFLACLSGCKRMDLHHNLQEIEADEILVVLQQNGIEALKEKEIVGQDVSWKISIAAKDGSKARQVLITNNLPRRRELGLSGVYKEKGLIPTPDEQKARFLLALKGEIINSLRKIPGVVDVDIVLNVPTESEFADLDAIKKRPTASVVVKTRNDELVAQTVSEGKVQRFVANTVPNLDPNDVTVIVSRTDAGGQMTAPLTSQINPQAVISSSPASVAALPQGVGPELDASSLTSLAGLKMDPSSVGRFKFYIIGLLSLLMGVSVFLLMNIMKLNRLRLRVQKGAKSAMPVLGEGGSAGLLEGGQGASGMEGTFDVGERQAR